MTALPALQALVDALPPNPVSPGERAPWISAIQALQDLVALQWTIDKFLWAVSGADTANQEALRLTGQMDQSASTLRSIRGALANQTALMDDASWGALLAEDPLRPSAWNLQEQRERSILLMANGQERLANDLAVNGYRAWFHLQQSIIGRIKIPMNGEELSLGQLVPKLTDPDRAVRQSAFAAQEAAVSEQAELCAHALNHLGGFRLALYKHRGWDHILTEALQLNRMEAATLEAMFAVVHETRPLVAQYVNRKARLLGLERLAPYDLSAPLFPTQRKVTYEESAQQIVDGFRTLSPRMAALAERAFRERWIDAENRPGRQTGGFCATFPKTGVSRIFMTHPGNQVGTTILAHELGHAFHNWSLQDLPPIAAEIGKNLGETASTLAELVVSSAALQATTVREERIAQLDDRLAGAAAYLALVPATYQFEREFYAARTKGPLSVAELCSMTQDADREAFAGALMADEGLTWALLPHFYIVETPFYNFPYTFGYLFSAALYATAREEGPAFEERYIALLRDTGRMSAEALAERHLGVDLRRPDFWWLGTQVFREDLKEFLTLTEGMAPAFA